MNEAELNAINAGPPSIALAESLAVAVEQKRAHPVDLRTLAVLLAHRGEQAPLALLPPGDPETLLGRADLGALA